MTQESCDECLDDEQSERDCEQDEAEFGACAGLGGRCASLDGFLCVVD
jgi:hypothetical protein